MRETQFFRISVIRVIRGFLKHADRAGNEKNDDAKRNQNLNHSEDFGPAREQRRIGRAEGRALGEGDKEVIDKTRPKTDAGKLLALVVWDLHLREKKAGAAEFLFFVALGCSAAIEPP